MSSNNKIRAFELQSKYVYNHYGSIAAHATGRREMSEKERDWHAEQSLGRWTKGHSLSLQRNVVRVEGCVGRQETGSDRRRVGDVGGMSIRIAQQGEAMLVRPTPPDPSYRGLSFGRVQ